MSQNEKKGRASALLPIIVFLLIFLGSGFITGDFYSMPAIVAFLIALVVAFAQNRELKFAEKIRLAAAGDGGYWYGCQGSPIRRSRSCSDW